MHAVNLHVLEWSPALIMKVIIKVGLPVEIYTSWFSLYSTWRFFLSLSIIIPYFTLSHLSCHHFGWAFCRALSQVLMPFTCIIMFDFVMYKCLCLWFACCILFVTNIQSYFCVRTYIHSHNLPSCREPFNNLRKYLRTDFL